MRTEFLLTFPCFAVVDSRGLYRFSSDGGATNAVAILSDADLLERFVSENCPGGKGLRFDFDAELALWLDGLPTNIQKIAVDPGTRSVVIGSIEDFQLRVLEHLSSNG